MKTLTLRTLAVLHLLLALAVLTALTRLDNTGVQATAGLGQNFGDIARPNPYAFSQALADSKGAA